MIDLPALKRNISRMSAAVKHAGLTLRPHAKTHKSAAVAALQVEAGAAGISCATVAEAEMLAAAGIGGLLLTGPLMSESKFARIAALHRRVDISIVADHPRQIEILVRQLGAVERPLPVLVDVDVGQRRTGVASISDGVALARAIAAEAKLQLAGIQGFAGHAQHVADPDERKRIAEDSANVLREFVAALSDAGLPPKLVTGGGTGTYLQDCFGPYTELQVGSYVFMDADYARIVDETGAAPAFEPSLFVLATVVSANRPGEVTIDAGTKALATNGPPPREILGAGKGAAYRFAGDEHGIVNVPAGQKTPALGARLLLGATHCDPTVNLYSRYHVVGEGGIKIWPIAGRYGD
ncbi:MAG TPA: alanine racemase [Xanthobacteraceae bacterium]|nr:alanine racemase [Xanthobacteraceae bacterium]